MVEPTLSDLHQWGSAQEMEGSTGILRCSSHADDGGRRDARSTARDQPHVGFFQRCSLLNQILGEADQRPALASTVESNFDFAPEVEQVVHEARCRGLGIHQHVWMHVIGAAAQGRTLMGVGFGHASSRGLKRVEAVSAVAVAPVHGAHRGHDARLQGSELRIEGFQEAEPRLTGQHHLLAWSGFFRPRHAGQPQRSQVNHTCQWAFSDGVHKGVHLLGGGWIDPVNDAFTLLLDAV